MGRRWDGGGTEVRRRWDGGGTEVGRRWDGGGAEVPAKFGHFFFDNFRHVWFGVVMLKVYFAAGQALLNDFRLKFI